LQTYLFISYDTAGIKVGSRDLKLGLDQDQSMTVIPQYTEETIQDTAHRDERDINHHKVYSLTIHIGKGEVA